MLSFVPWTSFEAIAASGDFDLKPGQKYEVIGGLWSHNVAVNLDTKDLAIISLVPLRLSGSEILKREIVPYQSVLTIVGKAPKHFLGFLYPDRYFVQVNTIVAPEGVPIIIDMHRGIEGKSTPLNPEIFRPLP
jgi:hypothetical protein